MRTEYKIGQKKLVKDKLEVSVYHLNGECLYNKSFKTNGEANYEFIVRVDLLRLLNPNAVKDSRYSYSRI